MILTLSEIRQQLEHLINATPSGTARNLLTNANIEMLRAEAVMDGQILKEEKLNEQG